jgi:predicted permease
MLRSLHFALRQLRKSPGYALAVIVTLALGIGVNTAVFSMVDGFMLRRLPYAEPERIATLITHVESWSQGRHSVEEDDSHSDYDWRAIRENVPAVTTAAWEGQIGPTQSGVNLKAGSDTGSAVRFVHASAVTAHYFEVLGMRPYLGRDFDEDESRMGGARAVILSYELWQSTFRGDRSVLGKSVEVKGEPYTIVGVLSPHAVTPNAASNLWTSLQPGDNKGACEGYDCGILMRLKPGATWQQAQAQLGHVQTHPDGYSGVQKSWFYAQPLQQYTGGDVKPKVLVLMIVVASILLIACANLAGLALVRISRRTQEIATRLALGASRMDVLRQLWMENFVLAVLGAGVGLALAELILSGLRSFLPMELIPPQGFPLDARVLFFTLGATLLTSVLFGALPALMTRRVDLRSSIAVSSYAVAGGSSRLRKVLIGAEVALTVVLVAGAGLLVRTLVHLETLPPGFDAHNVMTAKASLDDVRYHDASAFHSLLTKSLASMKKIPGVEDAAMGLSLPYERGLNQSFLILDGKQAARDDRSTVNSNMAYVTPEYFSTLRMPLLLGREFQEIDSEQSEPVAVVNASFAKRFFNETNVVGRHIGLRLDRNGAVLKMTIVGVVGDVTKEPGIESSGPLGTEPVYYVPATQFPSAALATVHLWFQPSWIVRTRGHVPELTAAMEHAMAEADPNLPFSGFYSMDDLMKQELQTQRVEVMLLSTLAGLALLLSAIGIYALVSNLVVQRTREIGIRMALGSTIHQAMIEIGLSGILAAVGGLVVGVGLSFFALRVLRSEIYGVGVYDPVTLLGAPMLLAMITFAATLLPTMRITRIDPAMTLRAE